ncbi:OmpA family protein [Shumkonia mesophila]|uniref:OmpA family protein n=1 Tax=Shumkonia mesophila TaxID=2838854 RepID=UPI0029347B18|nr:OmpA family protein [Shumkonia mesophila]
MTKKNFIGRPTARAMALAAGVGLLAAASGPALAQTAGFDSGDPAVTVDLSVLEGGGSSGPGAATSMPSAGGFSGRLRMPGTEAPVSRLYVKPRSEAVASPAPARERMAATSGRGPVMPPVKAPESSLRVPAPQVAAPAQPRPAPAVPAPATPAPSKPQTLAAVPPAPAVEKPQNPVAAPKPPATEKPPAAVAAPKAPVSAIAPPPPAIEKPEAAAPKPPAVPAAPPPAVEKPQVPTPQAPAVAVPTPPPPPAADAGAVAAAPATPPAVDQAALPKAGKATSGDALKVLFETEEAKLSEQARGELKTMVQGMLDKSDLRIQLLAYAGGDSLSSSKARRLSLSRALAVRSYLIENGLRSTRIDVRALGDKTTEEPVNRVDVNIVER